MRTGKERSSAIRSIKQRVARILSILHRAMPSATVELDHRNPLQLLIATILSAQCTDQRVNQVTPLLFRRYTEPADYAKADPAELETIIMPTGFYKSKTRSLIGTGKMLLERFGGKDLGTTTSACRPRAGDHLARVGEDERLAVAVSGRAWFDVGVHRAITSRMRDRRSGACASPRQA